MYNMNHYLLNPAAQHNRPVAGVAVLRKMWADQQFPSVQYLSANMLWQKAWRRSSYSTSSRPLRKTGLEVPTVIIYRGMGDTKLSFGLSCCSTSFS